MKKTIALLLTAALTLGPVCTMPVQAAGSVYELEAGSISDTGENATAVVSMSGASGDKAVDLKDSGDAVTVRYCQPYDENGKYQNLLVNGKKAGQIVCAYTGENTFRTVSISADLRAGENTVTIEGDWGWTDLGSLTVAGRGAVKSSFSANPVISRNVPAYAGSGKAYEANDDAYYTAWSAAAPDALAYDLSGVPASQRGKVLAVWYNGSTFDRVGRYITVDGEPTDYTIEINRAPGGSLPQDGWEVVETVKGKKVYGYLKKPLKAQVDEIVDALAELPEVAACYAEWDRLKDELDGYYHDEGQREHRPLSQQKEFRAIKNMVIREAENLRLSLRTGEDTEQRGTQTDVDNAREQYAALSAVRLLHHLSQIFRETPLPANPAGPRVDSKRRRKLLKKRLALGHRIDDHEDALNNKYQYPTQSM